MAQKMDQHGFAPDSETFVSLIQVSHFSFPPRFPSPPSLASLSSSLSPSPSLPPSLAPLPSLFFFSLPALPHPPPVPLFVSLMQPVISV